MRRLLNGRKKEFNQQEYIKEWKKKNMKQVKATFKNDFVAEFRDACVKLGIKQSDVIRQAMQDTIDKTK